MQNITCIFMFINVILSVWLNDHLNLTFELSFHLSLVAVDNHSVTIVTNISQFKGQTHSTISFITSKHFTCFTCLNSLSNMSDPALTTQIYKTVFAQMQNKSTFSDATLKVENDSFQVHKVILCGSSSYFR